MKSIINWISSSRAELVVAQLERTDVIAFPVDQGLQPAALDLEFGASAVVVRFAKPRKPFNV